MGITWIIGFLVIEVEELFALAYIFTIFVVFQGLFIFVIFVLLSKQVRENYIEWWKARLGKKGILTLLYDLTYLLSKFISMGFEKHRLCCLLAYYTYMYNRIIQREGQPYQMVESKIR